jgi:hypothetical protein
VRKLTPLIFALPKCAKIEGARNFKGIRYVDTREINRFHFVSGSKEKKSIEVVEDGNRSPVISQTSQASSASQIYTNNNILFVVLHTILFISSIIFLT